MSKTGDKRPAEFQLVPEDTPKTSSNSPSPSATPTGTTGLKLRPSLLSQVASNLSTYSKQVRETKPLSEPTLSLNFSKPQLVSPHSPKPINVNGGVGSPRSKRKLEDAPDSTTTKRTNNLFMECIEKSQQKENSTIEDSDSCSEGFIFGKELSSRATVSNTDINNPSTTPPSTTPPQTSSTGTTNMDKSTSEENPLTANDETATARTMAFRKQSSPALPEVEIFTGEEGEKHVIQISCKLFVFDHSKHNWEERGRGDIRLNDAPQSEGVFQSRLIMRANGSYRVLLNTNLWCQMTCDRASPQGIRITAQESNGEFGIYLIKGTSKDIQHLYTSINQRLQALRRSSKTSSTSSPLSSSTTEPHPPKDKSIAAGVLFDEDDKPSARSSPDSTPDSSPERFLERLENPSTTTASSCHSAAADPPPMSTTPTTLGHFGNTSDVASFASVVASSKETIPTTSSSVAPASFDQSSDDSYKWADTNQSPPYYD